MKNKYYRIQFQHDGETYHHIMQTKDIDPEHYDSIWDYIYEDNGYIVEINGAKVMETGENLYNGEEGVYALLFANDSEMDPFETIEIQLEEVAEEDLLCCQKCGNVNIVKNVSIDINSNNVEKNRGVVYCDVCSAYMMPECAPIPLTHYNKMKDEQQRDI